MTEIDVLIVNKNSPRKQFIQEFNIAFAKGDAEFIIDHVSDDIVWILHGDKKIEGKQEFSKEIHQMKEHVADKLTMKKVITHGRDASASGTIEVHGKSHEFCDVYTFKGASGTIIKHMESYVIGF